MFDPKMIAEKQARIQREFFAIHEHLQPEGDAIAELLDSGIASHTVLSLYPLDMVELARLIEARLPTPEQVWKFVATMESASWSNFSAIQDRLTNEHYEALGAESSRIYTKAKNFNAMSDAFKKIESKSTRGLNAYSAVTSALKDAARMLWLVANWGQLPELIGCEGTFSDQLEVLRKALDDDVQAVIVKP